jgi:hypothetical protein
MASVANIGGSCAQPVRSATDRTMSLVAAVTVLVSPRNDDAEQVGDDEQADDHKCPRFRAAPVIHGEALVMGARAARRRARVAGKNSD